MAIINNDLKLTGIKSGDISVVHRMGKKTGTNGEDKRSIIVKFCRRQTKVDVIKASRTMKVPGLYVKESLST